MRPRGRRTSAIARCDSTRPDAAAGLAAGAVFAFTPRDLERLTRLLAPQAQHEADPPAVLAQALEQLRLAVQNARGWDAYLRSRPTPAPLAAELETVSKLALQLLEALSGLSAAARGQLSAAALTRAASPRHAWEQRALQCAAELHDLATAGPEKASHEGGLKRARAGAPSKDAMRLQLADQVEQALAPLGLALSGGGVFEPVLRLCLEACGHQLSDVTDPIDKLKEHRKSLLPLPEK